MSEMKKKQGGSDEDAPRCPPHPGFVLGRCFLCGAKEEAAERGAPAVAVGHETMRHGGDGDGGDYAASCPPHPGFVHGICSRCGAAEEEEAGGGAPPGVAVGSYEVRNQGGGDDDDDDDGVEDAGGITSGGGVTVAYSDGEGPVLPELEAATGGSTSGGGITVAYIDGEGPALPELDAATIIVSASDRATLMRERKLILILDLDHTLLNSTAADDLSPGEVSDTNGDPGIGLFPLYSDSDDLIADMLVKLRPFVRGFLEQASAMFELHVCTLGTRVYARAVVALLDPAGVYFGGRIVSRNESKKRREKSLGAIQGADPAVAVIVDDTDHVWPDHQDNLIVIDRYLYFASACRTFGYHEIPSLAEHGVDEGEHDGSLAVVLGVLRRVHQGFFDGHRADVREVIAEMRRQVLAGCTVVFSFLEKVREDYPRPHAAFSWRLAEELGGVCRKDVDEEVTHVVAEDPLSEKAQWARDKGKFLVSPEWVTAASFRWRRPDEQEYPVLFSNLL